MEAPGRQSPPAAVLRRQRRIARLHTFLIPVFFFPAFEHFQCLLFHSHVCLCHFFFFRALALNFALCASRMIAPRISRPLAISCQLESTFRRFSPFVDRTDDQAADHRPDDAPMPAGKRGSADDDRCDRVKASMPWPAPVCAEATAR